MCARRPRVLFVYADRVAQDLGGTGIRALELARALSDSAEVSIAATESDGSDLGVPVATFAPHAPRQLAGLAKSADMIVAQPQWPLAMRALERSGAQLVFDLYDPELFGTIEHFSARPRRLRRTMVALANDRLNRALRLADRVICGGERQRDLWIGTMLAVGRIDRDAYARDPSYRSVIDTVPFGLPEEPPQRGAAPGPRELFGLAPDEPLALWNGGIWSWLDAETAIRAFAEWRGRNGAGTLVFMGASPSPAAKSAEARARHLAGELGLLGESVLFSETWVPYGERATWLLEADCAIYAHHERLEARYAHRTRLLDCFWAGLPIVCTTGDELAEEVDRRDLGATAPAGDHLALADALTRVFDRGRPGFGPALAEAASERTWARAVAPLVRWAGEPPPPRAGTLAAPPGERARTSAYLAAAAGAAALRLPAPRLP